MKSKWTKLFKFVFKLMSKSIEYPLTQVDEHREINTPDISNSIIVIYNNEFCRPAVLACQCCSSQFGIKFISVHREKNGAAHTVRKTRVLLFFQTIPKSKPTIWKCSLFMYQFLFMYFHHCLQQKSINTCTLNQAKQNRGSIYMS